MKQVDEHVRVREKSELHASVSPAWAYGYLVYSAMLFQSHILKR